MSGLSALASVARHAPGDAPEHGDGGAPVVQSLAGSEERGQQATLSRKANEAFYRRKRTQRQGFDDGSRASTDTHVRASLHAGAMEHLRTLAMKLET